MRKMAILMGVLSALLGGGIGAMVAYFTFDGFHLDASRMTRALTPMYQMVL